MMTLNLANNNNEYSWEPTAIPNNLKKYRIQWISFAECRKYPFGSLLLQQHQQDNLHFYYITASSTESLTISLQLPVHSILFNFLFTGNTSLYVNKAKQLLWLKEKHYTAFPIRHATIHLTIHPGITELFQVAIETENLQALFSKFEQLQKHLFPQASSGNTYNTPILPIDLHTENIIRTDLFTHIANDILTARLKTSVFHLIGHAEWQLATIHNTPAINTRYKSIIIGVQHEIDTQPNRLIQTEHYFAKKYGIGEVTLQRHFKLVLGVTLAAYRHKHCMLKAKELLHSGESIANISDTLGYSDATNFTKAFRDYFGAPPSSFRKGI